MHVLQCQKVSGNLLWALLNEITGPGKGYLCLMGCQWALASQNHSSSSPLEKMQTNSIPPTQEHGMKTIHFLATLYAIASANPIHTTLLVLGVIEEGKRKYNKCALHSRGCCPSLVHSSEEQRYTGPICPGFHTPEWLIGYNDTHAGSKAPGDQEKEELLL